MRLETGMTQRLIFYEISRLNCTTINDELNINKKLITF